MMTLAETINGRKYCFAISQCNLVVVIEGEDGFFPIDELRTDSREVDELNRRLGISSKEAGIMVLRSMRKQAALGIEFK